MKKLSVLFCAVAVVFASCSKDKNQSSDELKSVLLRISSVSPAPKSVEAPGVNTAGTIQLTDGLIVIAGSTGNITHKIPLMVANALSPSGQDLGAVPNNSSVLVVGNMGTAQTALNACATINQVLAVASNIELQTNYKKVALASTSAQAVGTPDAAGIARLNVSLVPVISRLEIAQVKALTQAEELAKAQAAAGVAGTPAPSSAAYITGFKVAGVYIDRYYPQFTFGGTSAGAYHQQMLSTDFTGIMPRMKDEGSWAAAGMPLIAAPAAGNIWAYNVASTGVVPRPIIKLTDITYVDATGVAQTMTEARYLTIASYKQRTSIIDAFVRGKIYRIGSTDGISFSIEDTSVNPNPDSEELYLHVGVTIQEWIIETPDGVLQ